MLRTRLLDTSTFRLTVVYFGVFGLSALVLLWGVYFLSERFINQEANDAIETEAAGLIEVYETGGWEALRDIIVDEAVSVDNGQDRSGPMRSIYQLFRPDPFEVIVTDLPDGLDYHPEGPASSYVSRPGDRRIHLRFQLPVGPEGRPRRMHEASGVVVQLEPGLLLLVGRDMQERLNALRLMRFSIGVGFAIMAVLGLVGGYFMSRWMLHRLDVINRTTSRIMGGDFSRRIDVSDTDDEFDELGRNVNLMLDRIDRLLASMRQVTDDIAHDLRTPLNRLRSRVELALMQDPGPGETREVLEATIRDADKLIETFNALLSIARAEAGGQAGDWERIDLAELAAEVFELYEPVAEDKGVTITLEGDDGPALLLGNRQLVAQTIVNLVDNALKYVPAGGRVRVRTEARPAPRLEVADDGPGIPPEERERAKQRFVRLDATRTTPGSGLGLSLVDAVAKLHEGRLDLLDNDPGLKVWLTFRPLEAGVQRQAAERDAAAAGPVDQHPGASA